MKNGHKQTKNNRASNYNNGKEVSGTITVSSTYLVQLTGTFVSFKVQDRFKYQIKLQLV